MSSFQKRQAKVVFLSGVWWFFEGFEDLAGG